MGLASRAFHTVIFSALSTWSLQASLITTPPAGAAKTVFPSGGGCSEDNTDRTFAGFHMTGTGLVCIGLDTGAFFLGANGVWTNNLIGINGDAGAIRIDLGRAYGSAGGFVNYSPTSTGDGPSITALDENGQVLESYVLSSVAPISTPGEANAGAFRGIGLTREAIRYLEIRNNFLAMSSITVGDPVPEPATWMLGLVAVPFLIRRQLRSRYRRGT